VARLARRIRELEPDDWAKFALGALTFLVGVLLIFNLVAPPAEHGYIGEMVVLVAIGLGSFWKSRESVNVGMFLYCSLALLPTLSMAHHHASQDGGFGPLWLVPFFGLLIVGSLIRDALATTGYTIVATGASIATGAIYGDMGLAVFLALMIGVAGVVWSVRLWQETEERKQRDEALAQLEIIQRGLGNIAEAIGGKQ
jgi:hypothetical protein